MRPLVPITLLAITLSPLHALAGLKTPLEKAKPKEFASRGKLLYQNHCTICHESNVHIRKKRKAKNIADIYKWVNKWAAYRHLEWSAEETKDVVSFINQKYYKYSK